MVVDFDEALAIVQTASRTFVSLPTQQLALLDCVGRVLAQTVTADRDQPAFDRSTRDGFAVRAAAVAGGGAVKSGRARPWGTTPQSKL